jgi:hypothetical protein
LIERTAVTNPFVGTQHFHGELNLLGIAISERTQFSASNKSQILYKTRTSSLGCSLTLKSGVRT